MKVFKAKVLFIVQLPPPIHGANLVNKQIVDNKLFSNNYKTLILPYNFNKKNTDLGSISWNKLFVFIRVLFSLIKTLILFKPDMVFLNFSFKNAALYRDLVIISILKIFRTKILFFLQGKGIKELSIENPYKKRMYKFAFNNSEVICLSNLLTYDIEDVFNGIPYVVNNGIEVENIDSISVTKENEIITLIYLSALSREKGLLILLDAVKLLQNKNIKFVLNIVGGDLTLSVQEVQAYITGIGLDDYVRIIGPKYGNDKYNELLKSDIFIFPTLNEAFPLVILEAIQCALPVVSTCEGGIPDIIDDGITGFLVEKNNPIQLADKIEVLINNPDLRKQMGEAGRKKFLEKYTLEVFEQNMKNVFDDILKKSK